MQVLAVKYIPNNFSRQEWDVEFSSTFRFFFLHADLYVYYIQTVFFFFTTVVLIKQTDSEHNVYVTDVQECLVRKTWKLNFQKAITEKNYLAAKCVNKINKQKWRREKKVEKTSRGAKKKIFNVNKMKRSVEL